MSKQKIFAIQVNHSVLGGTYNYKKMNRIEDYYIDKNNERAIQIEDSDFYDGQTMTFYDIVVDPTDPNSVDEKSGIMYFISSDEDLDKNPPVDTDDYQKDGERNKDTWSVYTDSEDEMYGSSPPKIQYIFDDNKTDKGDSDINTIIIIMTIIVIALILYFFMKKK